MYRTRDQFECIGGGAAGGPAALSLDQALPDEAAPRLDWRTRIERLFERLDLHHDLAEGIGTARWYRGFAAMLGLAIAALAFWPDFSAVEAATTVSANSAVRDEFRSEMIAPLALGADTGRHMGPTAAVTPLAAVPERPTLQLVATLGQSDSFTRMLQRAGVGLDDAAQASALIAAAVPLNKVGPGTRFAITLGRSDGTDAPRPLERLDFRARFDLDLSVERHGGALGLARHAVQVDVTPLRIRGAVGPSIFLSARGAGAPMKAIEQYLQTLSQHLSLEGDLTPTDQFDMIVAYKRTADGASEVGDLLYAGLERDGKPLAELVRWKDGRFVDAVDGGAAASETYAPSIDQAPMTTSIGMVQPVNGHITSLYGLRRHPILGYVRMHAGVDFGAAYGSPIFAVGDGIVSFAGRHGGHGNYVRIEHGGGLGTGYGHMSRIAVSPGMHVQAGQVIGYVGSSGLSTGPHLHYEVYENGRTVNPLGVHFSFKVAGIKAGPAGTMRPGIGKAELAAIKGKIAQLKDVAPGAALQKLGPRVAALKAKYESD